MENAWDHAQTTLEPVDETVWTFLDSEIDGALTSVRESTPDTTAETDTLTALITSLGG
ncbi:MAG: hypothetical protein ABIP17_07280 [Ilumatobacteraceae bacterium]